MAADVAQWEHNNIEFYASVFSNILIVLFKDSHVNIDLGCEMFKETIIKDFVIN